MLLQSLYTGVYSRGGPTNIEPSNELSALLDRSPADVRGVKFNSSPGASNTVAAAAQTFVLMRVCALPSLLNAWLCSEHRAASVQSTIHLNSSSCIVAAQFAAVAAACSSITKHAYADGKPTTPAGVQSPLSGSMTARGSPASGSMTARGTPRSLRTEPAAFGYGNNSPSGSMTARGGSSFSSTPPAGSTTMRGHKPLLSGTQHVTEAADAVQAHLSELHTHMPVVDAHTRLIP